VHCVCTNLSIVKKGWGKKGADKGWEKWTGEKGKKNSAIKKGKKIEGVILYV
jgi:hypothetical protein